MKKQTKLFTTLSAAALLTIGVSAVSMAAGWDNSTGEWRYLNNDGTEVTDAWKSANGNWFYLGSDGVMATNQLIEDNNNSTTRYYYVDQYGAMVKNTWKAVARDDGDDDIEAEYWWYYFGSDGKAYTTKNEGDLTTSKIKTIDGKKYAFDEEGHMLYGWIKEDSQDQNDNDEEAWKDSLYFFNGWNDGHMQTGWLQMTVEDDDDTKTYWFNFGSDGKKVGYNKDSDKAGKAKKKINGVYYHFAADGHMLEDWAVGTRSVENSTDASASEVKYLNGDGSERRKKWVWAIPDEHSDKLLDGDALKKDYDDDEYSWWYFDNSGKLAADDIKTINGRKYAFDKYGRMLYGFVAKNKGKSSNEYGTIVDLKKPSDYERDKYLAGTWQLADGDFGAELAYKKNSAGEDVPNYEIYFFSNDEEKDGSMKKGYQTLAMEDTTAQFYFNTGSGVAENGYVSKISKYCFNGMVLAPTVDDESNYAGVVIDPSKGIKSKQQNLQNALVFGEDIPKAKSGEAAILVNKSGSVVKNKAKLKDTNDGYYIVNKDGVILKYFPNEDDYNTYVEYTDKNESTKKISINSTMLKCTTTAQLDKLVAKAKNEKLGNK